MFKKLAVVSICLSCLNVIADECPFGICIGNLNVRELPQDIFETKDNSSINNIPGYREISIKTDKFMIDGDYPARVRMYVNQQGIVEALLLTYDVNNGDKFTSYLDRKYPKTYKETTFYGSYDIEYRNNNCLIRVTKTFMKGTELIYGTINWFEKYDIYRNKLDEMKEKRRIFADENAEESAKINSKRNFRKNRKNPWYRLFKEFDTSNDAGFNDFNFRKRRPHGVLNDKRLLDFNDDFGNVFDDFDKMFDDFDLEKKHCDICPHKHAFDSENDSPELREPQFDRYVNGQLNSQNNDENEMKSYYSSHSYSKVGDTETWIDDDNGKVTKVIKTPEGTRVINDEGDKMLSPPAKRRFNKKHLRRNKKRRHEMPREECNNFYKHEAPRKDKNFRVHEISDEDSVRLYGQRANNANL